MFKSRLPSLTRQIFTWVFSASILLLIASQPVAADDSTTTTPAVRIVNCDEKVQSHKRGICMNKMDDDDFRAFAPAVSWYYNWHYRTDDIPPSDAKMEFIPMAWGRPADVDGLDSYLAQASPKPRIVLAINEPNLKGQAFISPEKTADLYKKIKDVADKYQLAAVGPNMSLGSATNDSIKAMDPVENKELTYTFMVPFLKAFKFYMGSTEVPAMGIHTYGQIGEMKWAIKSLHDEFNCPIWVTEYAEYHAPDTKEAREYLIQATDFLERTPYVQGYAWFKERANDNDKISLLLRDHGKLSPLGEAYVAMPVHDDNLYYRIPGKLPAGNYRTIDQIDIMSNSHNDLLLNSTAGGASADYNIQIDTAGTYKLSFRVFGTGKIEVLEGDKVLTSIDAAASEVQNIDASLDLPEGTHTLKVRFGATGIILSSLEFSKP